MNVFEELMLARQLSFTVGDIHLLGNRVTIVHATFWAEYTMRMNEDPKKVFELYDSAKISFRDGMAKSIGKRYGLSFNDFFKWLTDIAMLAGWGKLTWVDLNDTNKTGIILVDNSPVVEVLKGKVHNPIDHLIRGFIAGGASGWLNTDIDAIEEECAAMGAPQCKFVFRPKEQFKVTPEVTRQLGIQ
jgi:predicted hydrocarbon binding protein